MRVTSQNRPAFSNFAYYYNGQEYTGPPQQNSGGTDWYAWGQIGANMINTIWGPQQNTGYTGSAYTRTESTGTSSETESIPIWLVLLVIGFVIALILLQG